MGVHPIIIFLIVLLLGGQSYKTLIGNTYDLDTIGDGTYYAQGLTANMPSHVPATREGLTTWMIKVMLGKGDMSVQYAHSLDLGLFYRVRYRTGSWADWYKVTAEIINQ